MGLAITQHLESYIRNRNNPDSEITCRHISQSNKGATEKRSKYLSHNKDNYFQQGLCRCTFCLQLQPSPKKRGQLGLEGIQSEDLNELCSLTLQLRMSNSRQLKISVHYNQQGSCEVPQLYIWAINLLCLGQQSKTVCCLFSCCHCSEDLYGKDNIFNQLNHARRCLKASYVHSVAQEGRCYCMRNKEG